MPNLASSAVTILEVWTEGDTTGKRLVNIRCHASLNGQGDGGVGTSIPKTAFGLSRIEKVSNFVLDDLSVIAPAAVTPDGEGILLLDVNNATDAERSAPALFTGEFYFVVTGIR